MLVTTGLDAVQRLEQKKAVDVLTECFVAQLDDVLALLLTAESSLRFFRGVVAFASTKVLGSVSPGG